MVTKTETTHSETDDATSSSKPSTRTSHVGNVNMPRDGFIASALGMHNGPQGPISKIVNVAGRVALVAGAALGISRLFGSEEVQMQDASAVGAYEPS